MKKRQRVVLLVALLTAGAAEARESVEVFRPDQVGKQEPRNGGTCPFAGCEEEAKRPPARSVRDRIPPYMPGPTFPPPPTDEWSEPARDRPFDPRGWR